jgi:hypothetical protein
LYQERRECGINNTDDLTKHDTITRINGIGLATINMINGFLAENGYPPLKSNYINTAKNSTLVPEETDIIVVHISTVSSKMYNCLCTIAERIFESPISKGEAVKKYMGPFIKELNGHTIGGTLAKQKIESIIELGIVERVASKYRLSKTYKTQRAYLVNDESLLDTLVKKMRSSHVQ